MSALPCQWVQRRPCCPSLRDSVTLLWLSKLLLGCGPMTLGNNKGAFVALLSKAATIVAPKILKKTIFVMPYIWYISSMFCFHGLLILKMKCNRIVVPVVMYENLQFGRKQGFIVWTYSEVTEFYWAESYDAIFLWVPLQCHAMKTCYFYM